MSLHASYSRLLSRNRWAKGQSERALAQCDAHQQQLQQRRAELADQRESLQGLYDSLAPLGLLSRSMLTSGQRKQAVMKKRLGELRSQIAGVELQMLEARQEMTRLREQQQQLIRKDKKLETGYQRARREGLQRQRRTEENDTEENSYAYPH